MKEVERLIETLHPLERVVLPVLKDGINLSAIINETNLKEVEVMRALQWLENKNIIKVKKTLKEIISFDKNGLVYVKKGLPEKRFLEVLEEPLSLDEIKEKADLNEDELNISLGILKKKSAIVIDKKIKITNEGKELLVKESLEEQFFKKLPLEFSKLKPEEKYAFNELKRRKQIVKSEVKKIRTVSLTDLGKRLVSAELKEEFIESLTPSIVKSGSWKKKRFRRYDIAINVPKVFGGKRHFINQTIDYIKKIWLDLGFKEMKGPIVDTSFWNFDALFVPQDHPARDLQATFYVKEPKYGKLLKNVVSKVKAAHENGYGTGSTGWQYKWDEKKAKELVLRTHTTILSARTIAQLKKEDLPAKFFSVGRNFRNETLDWAHLFELIQVEGIVVSEDVNFKHLLGYLKEFYKKMGYEKIRFRAGYFPYTEPSLEIDVLHPVKKEWIELGGAGIFRPEVVKPLLGKAVPVLAWGLGLERTAADYYNIKDIRDFYKNDLKKLRGMKIWLR